MSGLVRKSVRTSLKATHPALLQITNFLVFNCIEAEEVASEYKRVSRKLGELRKEIQEKKKDHKNRTGRDVERGVARKWDKEAIKESSKEAVHSPTFNR